jgi:hypothetical protein
MDGACSTCGRDKNTYSVLVGKHEGKNHLEELGIERMTLKQILNH